jgi:hypothetical protein
VETEPEKGCRAILKGSGLAGGGDCRSTRGRPNGLFRIGVRLQVRKSGAAPTPLVEPGQLREYAPFVVLLDCRSPTTRLNPTTNLPRRRWASPAPKPVGTDARPQQSVRFRRQPIHIVRRLQSNIGDCCTCDPSSRIHHGSDEEEKPIRPMAVRATCRTQAVGLLWFSDSC